MPIPQRIPETAKLRRFHPVEGSEQHLANELAANPIVVRDVGLVANEFHSGDAFQPYSVPGNGHLMNLGLDQVQTTDAGLKHS